MWVNIECQLTHYCDLGNIDEKREYDAKRYRKRQEDKNSQDSTSVHNTSHDSTDSTHIALSLTPTLTSEDQNTCQATPDPVDQFDDSKRSLKDQVNQVFSYWMAVMNKNIRTKLTDKREIKIEGRLKSGYSLTDIKLAIDNCAKSPHNMGDNERQTVYNDIELICRDDTKLEYFRDSVGQGELSEKAPTAEQLLNNYDW
jgi:hypothetical protein